MTQIISQVSTSDILHLKELSELYYPTNNNLGVLSEDRLNEIKQFPSKSMSNKISKPVSKTYKCCKMKTTSYKLSIDHWIEFHHLPNITDSCSVTTTQHGTLPRIKIDYSKRCNSLTELGNSELPLIERASYFLHSIKNTPSSCHLFRPYRNQNPQSISNPYSAAVSLAYDFIETVAEQPREYRYFLTRLLNHPSERQYPGTLRDHLPYWIFWFNYCSTLNPTKTSSSQKTKRKSQEISIDSLQLVTDMNLNTPSTSKDKEAPQGKKRPRTKTKD